MKIFSADAPDFADYLLERGADTGARDARGRSASEIAIASRRDRLAKKIKDIELSKKFGR